MMNSLEFLAVFAMGWFSCLLCIWLIFRKPKQIATTKEIIGEHNWPLCHHGVNVGAEFYCGRCEDEAREAQRIHWGQKQ